MADRAANEPRYPCKVCGRQFFKESLQKHQPICAKTAKGKQRKVFDSAKQRAGEGSDLSYKQIKQAQKKTVEPPKSNWRAKHEDFINTVRAARGVSKAMAAGEPLPPPPPPSINPDYIQCPYCNRRFSQQAADRHINFCKEQSQRVNNRPPPNATAKAKQATRTQYQPPKPKVKAATSPAAAPAAGGPAARGPAGPGARAGAGAAPRGRATGSYQHLSVGGAKVGSRKASPRLSPRESPPTFHHTTTTTTSDRLPGSRDRTAPRGTRSKMTYNQDRYAGNTGRYKDDGDMFDMDAGDPPVRSGRDQTRYAGEQAGYASTRGGYLSDQSRYSSCQPDPYSPTQMGGLTQYSSTAPSGRSGAKLSKTAIDRFSDYPDWPPVSEDLYPSNGQMPDFAEHFNSNGSRRHTVPQSTHPLDRNGGYSSSKKSAAKIIIGSTTASRFCHECGSRYPVSSAKFCCDCGARRISLS